MRTEMYAWVVIASQLWRARLRSRQGVGARRAETGCALVSDIFRIRKKGRRRFEMNSAFSTDSSSRFISVTNPFDGVEVGTVVNIPPEGAQVLIQTAKDGARVCRNLSRYERARVLETCASLVDRDQDVFASLIVAEAGKTVRQARKEVLRCVNTLKLSPMKRR
ncbi:aldehyde dehydrogenase family protein [Paraburkholderia panacisoli]|uniref:Aldehyde dehydrogenase family protein n=2 Tax=Paraburkholderia panacisoli TaxID=2603818 RepID=A0A5B0GR57_9BURK|nr:aldehyde dehydrogenase family protein [Paraburkholderia panacisoli]